MWWKDLGFSQKLSHAHFIRRKLYNPSNCVGLYNLQHSIMRSIYLLRLFKYLQLEYHTWYWLQLYLWFGILDLKNSFLVFVENSLTIPSYF